MSACRKRYYTCVARRVTFSTTSTAVMWKRSELRYGIRVFLNNRDCIFMLTKMGKYIERAFFHYKIA